MSIFDLSITGLFLYPSDLCKDFFEGPGHEPVHFCGIGATDEIRFVAVSKEKIFQLVPAYA